MKPKIEFAASENGSAELDATFEGEQPDESVDIDLYDILTYGADYTVSVYLDKLKKGQIEIPEYQRKYVWTLPQASRFIESLIIGLPIPNIFLAKEPDTGKFLVVDGQQRLRTLQFFIQEEKFDKKAFRLKGVKPEFNGLTYSELQPRDQLRIDDTIIHAIIFEQLAPKDDPNAQKGFGSSVFHIFERINTGGTRLTPQEVRGAVYYGDFAKLLIKLGKREVWDSMTHGKTSSAKREELALRFLAFYHRLDQYKKPLVEFLNKFLIAYRNPGQDKLSEFEQLFDVVFSFIAQSGLVRKELFVRKDSSTNSFNAAIFDSVSVSVANWLVKNDLINQKHVAEAVGNAFKEAYSGLLDNQEYVKLCTGSTSDENNVKRRFELAKQALNAIKI